ncbi:MAG: hypothetical protein KGO23_12230, partial [Nitrospirota bacterium]|nr:hypothetical protein [Nitrospirota bacterium]
MHNRRGWLLKTIFALALMTRAQVTLAAPSAQESFASPEAAITALVEAVKVNDQPMLRAIL